MHEIYRGQAKSGTTHFHAYATASIVRRGQRFTGALRRVEHGTPMLEVLKRVLQRVKIAHYKVTWAAQGNLRSLTLESTGPPVGWHTAQAGTPLNKTTALDAAIGVGGSALGSAMRSLR